jgi:crotonobetainyl-CoA:carnitine CoA-transferase CaiB-like acyl-CoA transferase
VVADFSRVLAGPLATMMMGDLGADVIKVERPAVGDDTREWGPPFVGEESAYYLSVNRNKRCVALDLRSDEGLAAAWALVEQADVLVENFSVGTMDRLGFAWDEVHARNPRLVYCSISGFGRRSGAAMPGYDFLVQAVGGLMSITGDESGPPAKVGVALVDVVAGLHATIGVLAALRARDETGAGQRVDINLMSSLLSSLVNQASSYVTAGVRPHRLGNRHPSIAPYETFDAADGVLAVAVGNDTQFGRLCAELGLDDMAIDDRFATNAARVTNRDELAVALSGVLRTQSVAHWAQALGAIGVPSGPVNDLAQAFAFATELGLTPVKVLERADGSQVPVVASPLELSDTPVTYRLAPPSLGDDTSDVLSWLKAAVSGTRDQGGADDAER